MAEQLPPPYPGANQAPSYPPGDATKQAPPPDGQQPSGYPPQATPGYPQQPGSAYPAHGQVPYPGQTGYPPQSTGGYPPQGQGYIQQPAGQTMTNTNTTVVVTQQPTITTAVIPYVNDYMGLSIFSCFCCCWILGLFAIIKSYEARNNYAAGNYTQAVASATTARNISYASIFCGIGIYILITVLNSVQ